MNSYTIICNNPGLITNPNPQLSAVKCSSEWTERLTSNVEKKEPMGSGETTQGLHRDQTSGVKSLEAEDIDSCKAPDFGAGINLGLCKSSVCPESSLQPLSLQFLVIICIYRILKNESVFSPRCSSTRTTTLQHLLSVHQPHMDHSLCHVTRLQTFPSLRKQSYKDCPM